MGRSRHFYPMQQLVGEPRLRRPPLETDSGKREKATSVNPNPPRLLPQTTARHRVHFKTSATFAPIQVMGVTPPGETSKVLLRHASD